MIRALALLGILAGTAHADGEVTTTGEAVTGTIDEQQTEFGKLHITAALLGYQLSAPSGGPVSTLSAVFELQSRIFVRGSATLPLLGVVKGDAAPYRLEGGIHLWFKNKLELENEEIVISQDSKSKQFVNHPIMNRNRLGLNGGLMYAHGGEKYDAGNSSMTSTSDALMAVVGYGGTNSAGFSATLDGYGKRSNYRWMAFSLEALIDLKRTYDGTAPAEKGSRFGGRLWAETLWFPTLGMSARLELGKYPAHAGWMLVAAIGGSLHI